MLHNAEGQRHRLTERTREGDEREIERGREGQRHRLTERTPGKREKGGMGGWMEKGREGEREAERQGGSHRLTERIPGDNNNAT